jgi:serine protease Do
MKVADFGVEGVGFAIPSDAAMPIVQDLLKYGKVNRPYLGVYTMDLQQYFAQQAAGNADGSNGAGDSGDGASPDSGGNDPSDSVDGGQLPPPPDLKLPKDVTSGVIVLQAVGPAEKAGLKLNDVIVKLDKQPIGSTLDLRKYLYDNKSIGDEIEVTFYRDGEKETTMFKLGEKAED